MYGFSLWPEGTSETVGKLSVVYEGEQQHSEELNSDSLLPLGISRCQQIKSRVNSSSLSWRESMSPYVTISGP